MLVRVDVLGEAAMIIATAFDEGQPLRLALIDADPNETRQRMAAGEIVVSTVLSERLKLKSGDQLEIPTPNGSSLFRIAALANDYAFGGVVVHLDEAVARKIFEVEGAHAFAVTADPEKLPAIEKVSRHLRRTRLDASDQPHRQANRR